MESTCYTTFEWMKIATWASCAMLSSSPSLCVILRNSQVIFSSNNSSIILEIGNSSRVYRKYPEMFSV